MGLVSSDGRNGCGKMKQSRSTQGRGADAGGARAGNGFSVDLLRSGRPRLKSLLIYSSLVQTAVLGRTFQKAFSRLEEAALGGFDPSRSSLRSDVLSPKVSGELNLPLSKDAQEPPGASATTQLKKPSNLQTSLPSPSVLLCRNTLYISLCHLREVGWGKPQENGSPKQSRQHLHYNY